MIKPDDALVKLKEIIKNFSNFCELSGNVSESDTRAKVIDAILKDVCGWPETAIRREEHTDSGFMDYCLSVHEKENIIIEAKREGKYFEIPQTKARRLKISGTLLTDKNIKTAINQVRQYCDDRAIRYAIVTNGYTWIIFRAIRDDIPWRDGQVIIFPTLDNICLHFTEFWNILSCEAITQGSLNKHFSSSEESNRKLLRAIDLLRNPNRPLDRNRLSNYLDPLIKMLFEDISWDIDILEYCYIYSHNLRTNNANFEFVLEDSVPLQLKSEGAVDISATRYDSGGFSKSLDKKVESKKGEIFLLLGGIGSGKTTFLKRYQNSHGKKLLENSIWFHLDFIAAPIAVESMETFIWRLILDQIHQRYGDKDFETRQNIKGAFSDKIKTLKETVLKGFTKELAFALLKGGKSALMALKMLL